MWRKSLVSGIVLAFLGACSSSEPINVEGGSTEAVRNVRIFKKDSSAMLQNASLGTLPFFYGGARGVNVGGIKWNQPVTPENPGSDCELSYVAGKGSSHFFRCIAKEGTAHIIVSMQEDLVEGRRMLRRVFMDGKGEALVTQWGSALERMGYKRSNAQITGVKDRYVSHDSQTFADVIWVASSQSATLRLSPRL